MHAGDEQTPVCQRLRDAAQLRPGLGWFPVWIEDIPISEMKMCAFLSSRNFSMASIADSMLFGVADMKPSAELIIFNTSCPCVRACSAADNSLIRFPVVLPLSEGAPAEATFAALPLPVWPLPPPARPAAPVAPLPELLPAEAREPPARPPPSGSSPSFPFVGASFRTSVLVSLRSSHRRQSP